MIIFETGASAYLIFLQPREQMSFPDLFLFIACVFFYFKGLLFFLSCSKGQQILVLSFRIHFKEWIWKSHSSLLAQRNLRTGSFWPQVNLLLFQTKTNIFSRTVAQSLSQAGQYVYFARENTLQVMLFIFSIAFWQKLKTFSVVSDS